MAILSDTLGYSYSTVSGYRSAISKYHVGDGTVPVGQNRTIQSITRATFIANPLLTRYSEIWDVQILMDYLETLYPHENLSDFDLGLKTYSLCAVFSISRSSSVALLLPRFQLVGGEVVLPLAGLEKNSRPGMT